MVRRRELLGVAGAAGAVAAAGCLGGFGDDDGTAAGAADDDGGTDQDDHEEPEDGEEDEEEEEEEETVRAVRLEDLSVQNNHADEHRVQVAVDADGDMMHLGTYDLEGEGGSTTIAGDWEDAAASYRVHARLDEGEILTEDVTDGVAPDTDCVRALVRVDSEGDLAVWVGSNCRT